MFIPSVSLQDRLNYTVKVLALNALSHLTVGSWEKTYTYRLSHTHTAPTVTPLSMLIDGVTEGYLISSVSCLSSCTRHVWLISLRPARFISSRTHSSSWWSDWNLYIRGHFRILTDETQIVSLINTNTGGDSRRYFLGFVCFTDTWILYTEPGRRLRYVDI